jgi:hypothetical protein
MTDERMIEEVWARYVRAADMRDGDAMKKLFIADAKVEVFYNNPKPRELLGELVGADAIGVSVSQMMKPHPPLGASHHTTSNSIIDISGNKGNMSVQFIVFNIVGLKKPANGWPAGSFGAQGSITPIESGHYEPSFEKINGEWMITHLRVLHDLPYAF